MEKNFLIRSPPIYLYLSIPVIVFSKLYLSVIHLAYYSLHQTITLQRHFVRRTKPSTHEGELTLFYLPVYTTYPSPFIPYNYPFITHSFNSP